MDIPSEHRHATHLLDLVDLQGQRIIHAVLQSTAFWLAALMQINAAKPHAGSTTHFLEPLARFAGLALGFTAAFGAAFGSARLLGAASVVLS